MDHSALVSRKPRFVVALLTLIMPGQGARRQRLVVDHVQRRPVDRSRPSDAPLHEADAPAAADGNGARGEPAWTGHWRNMKYL